MANVPAALDALAPGWTGLHSHLDTPGQSLPWIRACAESFGSGEPLAVFGVGPVGAPEAIAPLSWRSGLPGWLELLGVQETYEPGDFLYRSPDALEALVRGLIDGGTPLLFRRMLADAPATQVLQRAFKRRGMLHLAPAGSCPYIALDESWVEPERHFPRKRRTDFRRSRRLADEAGEVTFEILSPTPDTVDAVFREALDVEHANWKARNGTSLHSNPAQRRFFERWARASAAEGALRIGFLRIDGKAAAMELAEERGGRYWTLKIGYDEAFAGCSPGTLLALHMMAWAAGRGLQSYEFMGFSAEWTRRWTATERPCVSMRVYPVGVRGIAALGRDMALSAHRRLVRRGSAGPAHPAQAAPAAAE